MKQIPARVFYEKSTGKILFTTSECEVDVSELTKEYYMKVYKELEGKNIDEVDFIELEYGTLVTTFNNAKSYSINLETKKLEVVYYTQEELNAMQQQNQEIQDLNARISDITEYLSNSDETTIADLEKSIFTIELNNLKGGI